jgi:hypothetical protein
MTPPRSTVGTLTAIDAAYFEAALRLAPSLPSGFKIADVDRVESACHLREPAGSRYGYITALKNGRRVFLSVAGVSPQAVHPGGIEIADLLPRVARPDLGPAVQPDWYLPVLLNTYLEELR